MFTNFFFFSFFILFYFSHNINLTPFTTKYKNKIIIIIIITIIIIIVKVIIIIKTIIITKCVRAYIIDENNKIFLVQR